MGPSRQSEKLPECQIHFCPPNGSRASRQDLVLLSWDLSEGDLPILSSPIAAPVTCMKLGGADGDPSQHRDIHS
jgi:hypothetical protein